MAETIDIKEFKKQEKRAKRREAINKLIHDGAEWYNNNREYAAVLIGLGVFTIKELFSLGKKGISNAKQRREEELRYRTVWDPSERHWWQLRRSLTSDEWIRVSERRAKGEKLANILNEMKVLR